MCWWAVKKLLTHSLTLCNVYEWEQDINANVWLAGRRISQRQWRIQQINKRMWNIRVLGECVQEQNPCRESGGQRWTIGYVFGSQEIANLKKNNFVFVKRLLCWYRTSSHNANNSCIGLCFRNKHVIAVKGECSCIPASSLNPPLSMSMSMSIWGL